jgi:MFS family permease
MSAGGEPLYTRRFFVMCGFTFTVFLSAFQLLPTAPFRILDLGGTKLSAGLFLGFLTYASAFSAPLTGALADRVGKRRMLVACSLAIAGFSAGYAVSTDYRLPLVLAFFHGLFWSGLLSASAAYMTDVLPESRRAEGIGIWGLSTILAIAVAPGLGLWIYGHGWVWLCAVIGLLNLAMAAIAASLDEAVAPAFLGGERFFTRRLLEWRVLLLSVTLFLCSFGYGGVTSFIALYAEENGVSPRGIYFTSFALVMLVSRPLAGRLADRIGHKKVLVPCLVLVAFAFVILALRGTRPWLVASAVVFGAGFGTAYPIFVAYVMTFVAPTRRGAAFGGILAAVDVGIGTGSIATGWMVERLGFSFAGGVRPFLSGSHTSGPGGACASRIVLEALEIPSLFSEQVPDDGVHDLGCGRPRVFAGPFHHSLDVAPQELRERRLVAVCLQHLLEPVLRPLPEGLRQAQGLLEEGGVEGAQVSHVPELGVAEDMLPAFPPILPKSPDELRNRCPVVFRHVPLGEEALRFEPSNVLERNVDDRSESIVRRDSDALVFDLDRRFAVAPFVEQQGLAV